MYAYTSCTFGSREKQFSRIDTYWRGNVLHSDKKRQNINKGVRLLEDVIIVCRVYR